MRTTKNRTLILLLSTLIASILLLPAERYELAIPVWETGFGAEIVRVAYIHSLQVNGLPREKVQQ